MATIDLGKIKQVWRGTYAGSTAYTPDDVVQYTDSGLVSSYICIANTTGNAPSSSGTAHGSWNYLAKGGAAGTDGTDVGATLANKEIAFKTNAGAVDGIPIGTAGQVLKVNSGATGYEYGAVSSDYVKITSGTWNDVSNLDFAASLFVGSTYKSFINMIEVEDQDGVQSGNGEFRPQINGSNISNNFSSCGIGMNSSSSNISGLNRDNADSCIFLNDGLRAATSVVKIESNGMNRDDVNNNHFINYIRPNHDAATRCRWDFHACFHAREATSGDGYRLQFQAGTKGKYCLYGRK